MEQETKIKGRTYLCPWMITYLFLPESLFHWPARGEGSSVICIQRIFSSFSSLIGCGFQNQHVSNHFSSGIKISSQKPWGANLHKKYQTHRISCNFHFELNFLFLFCQSRKFWIMSFLFRHKASIYKMYLFICTMRKISSLYTLINCFQQIHWKCSSMANHARSFYGIFLFSWWLVSDVCISGRKDLPTASIGAVAVIENVPSSFGCAAQAYPDPECVQSASANNFAPPAMLQFAKTRKLSIERSELRKYV